MTRNLSTLEFQRRLIRTALQSPRGECMNLLGIVYSNLEEFIVDRLPFDDDLDRTVDHLSEVFALLEMAVAKKFTNLYIENLPENWESALDLLYGPDTDMAEMAGIRKDYMDFMKRNSVPGVLTRDGQKFISKAFILPDIISGRKFGDGDASDRYLRNAVAHGHAYSRRSSGLRLSRSIRRAKGTVKGAEIVGRKFEDASNSTRRHNITVRFVVNDGHTPKQRSFVSDMGIVDHRVITPVCERANNFVYQIVFENPVMLEFDKVAGMILARYRKSPKFPAVAYLPDTFAMNSMRTMEEPIPGEQWQDNPYQTEFYRGPFNDDYLLMQLCDTLCISKMYLQNCTTIEEIASVAHDYKEPLSDAFITIYRTDPIETFAKSFNLKFLYFLAIKLQKHLHIVIECRAHRDETNNVHLYQSLSNLGVDIRAGAEYNSTGLKFHVNEQPTFDPREFGKIHAKTWQFCFASPIDSYGTTVVELLSTGNFSSMAQRGFVDSYMVIRHKDAKTGFATDMLKMIFGAEPFSSSAERSSYPNQFFRSIYLEAQRDGKFIFLQKAIRRKLLEEIAMAQRKVRYRIDSVDKDIGDERPFIFIKVNHITDTKIIRALCNAADAGVDVQICARTSSTIPLNAGIRGIHVNSICGKYLEHDRWFIFGTKNAKGDVTFEKCYMSSADLMPRNLDNRLEFMYRIDDIEQMEVIATRIYNYCNLASDPKIGYFNYDLIP